MKQYDGSRGERQVEQRAGFCQPSEKIEASKLLQIQTRNARRDGYYFYRTSGFLQSFTLSYGTLP